MVAKFFSMTAPARRIVARLIAVLSLMWLAACDITQIAGGEEQTGQRIVPGAPVKVALLVPGGTGVPELNMIAADLEKAARMAINDLEDVQIELAVYNTARNPQTASVVAAQAVAEGAQIIVGPLDAQSAHAVGQTVAPANMNILAFSNNPSIAGGNIFILGRTFENIANRLVTYTASQGISRYLIVHQDDLAGQVGRDAIVEAIRTHGATLGGVQAYPFSQAGINDRASGIVQSVGATNSQAVFVTDTLAGGLPILATALTDRGLNPSATPLVGIADWDAQPQAATLSGLQNGYFAGPDAALEAGFANRFESVYGSRPHALASLAYDGIAAIGALVATGDRNALMSGSLTRRSGFAGATGIFRLEADGTNTRALAVSRVMNNQFRVVSPAPRNFGNAGS